MTRNDSVKILARLFSRYPSWGLTEDRRKEVLAGYGQDLFDSYSNLEAQEVLRLVLQADTNLGSPYPPAFAALVHAIEDIRSAEWREANAVDPQPKIEGPPMTEDQIAENKIRFRKLMDDVLNSLGSKEVKHG